MSLARTLYNLLFFFSFVICEEYDPATECVNGIRTAIAEFHFAGTSPEDYWVNLCTNNLSVTSLWASTKLYCDTKEVEVGTLMIEGYCTKYGEVTLTPYVDFLPNLTDEFVASLQTVDFETMTKKEEINHPFVLSKSLYETGRRTTSSFERQYKLHASLGWAVYGFWGFVLLTGIIHRIISYVLQRRYVLGSRDLESTTPVSKPAYIGIATVPALQFMQHWLRTNLVTPATIGSHHQRLFWGCTIPTRIQTLVVVSFWILNFILCCIAYEIFWPNLYYTVAIQNWRYISDRTGILAISNLPLIWLFSGRNNIFIWLTGWSFSTFNVFHRNVARIATIQAIVHSIGYTAMEINFKSLAEEWKEQYWYMGAIATIVMSLLLLSSSVYVRQRSYEVFLLLHIVFSIMTIVGMFYHTAIFEDLEYYPYLWPIVAIWSFDRAARLFRIAFCNLHIRISKAPVRTSATVSYDADADLIRLCVVPGFSLFKPAPGQHYFIYQPMRWKGWENHPFTLAGWENKQPSHAVATEVVTPQTQETSQEKEICVTPHDAESNHSSNGTSPALNHDTNDENTATTLSFLIRPVDSWTARLRDECRKSASNSITTGILVEGPYGETSPLHMFESIIFVVGGTGIACALPYLQEHARAMKRQVNHNYPSLNTRTRDITLIWAAKQAAILHDVANRELQPLLMMSDVHVQFHATRETPGLSASDHSRKSTSSEANVEINFNRPNIQERILNTIARLKVDGPAHSKVAIVACGPASMADEARATAHQALKSGDRGVEYFEEAFGW